MSETIEITELVNKFNALEKDLDNVKKKQIQTDILLHQSITKIIDLTFNKTVTIESSDVKELQTLVSQIHDSGVKKSLRSSFMTTQNLNFMSRVEEIQCI